MWDIDTGAGLSGWSCALCVGRKRKSVNSSAISSFSHSDKHCAVLNTILADKYSEKLFLSLTVT